MSESSARLIPRWLALVALTAALVAIFELLHLSAAILVGAMLAAIALAATGRAVRIPRPFFLAAQAFIGCMVARAMVPSILHEMVVNLPLFAAVVLSVIAAAVGLGVLLARWRVLPGTTALWGCFPGAAAAMTLMSEVYGADMRLVAFMQYLRVVIVALLASLVARFWAVHSGGAGAAPAFFPPIHALAFAETLALATGAAAIGVALRVPVGALLGPMVIGTALQDLAGLRIELPPTLLAAAYLILGWSIGLRFTREILRHAMHAFPRVLASILTLVAGCGVLAAALVVFAHVDPLTAYLATSPGGADSVAIIAASSKVDMPFVMAMQVMRFLVILAIGPWLARTVAAWVARRSAPPP